MISGLVAAVAILVVVLILACLYMRGVLTLKNGRQLRCCCRRKKKMGEIVIDMQEFNEVVTILEKGKQKLDEKEKEIKKVSAKIAFEDSFFGGDEYKEVIDPDMEMDYSKFTL